MTRVVSARTFFVLGALLVAVACRDIVIPTTSSMRQINGVAAVSLESNGVESIAPGRVIVRYKEGADHAAVEAAFGVTHLADLGLPRGEVLTVPVGSEVAMASSIAGDPNVEFAQVDNVMVLQPCELGQCEQPTDGFFPRKWDLHNDGTVRTSLASPTLLALTDKVDADIDWLEMFDFVGPAPTGAAKIGIVDTGIRDTHQDIVGKVVAANNFAFLYDPTLIADRVGHGSHVTGIAAAHGNNGVGVAGLAYGPNVKVINAKACELYNVAGVVQTLCFESSVANAITYAVNQGANVINLSLGGSAPSALQQAALQFALANNVLPVCATGNNNAALISFPARFPECFAVGATDWGDNRASYSNFGPEIDVVAPGGDLENQPHSLILSLGAGANNQYAFNAGTSMATPQVTGLAALIFAQGIATTPAAIADRIRNTTDDLGPPGFDNEFGFGRINAYRAITGVSPNAPPIPVIGGPYGPIVEGSSIAFNGSGSSDPNGQGITFAWTFGDGGTGTGAAPTHPYADNGSYSVTMTVTDESGASSTTGTTVVVTNAAPVVNVSLSSGSILSGQSVDLTGGFSDLGVNDAPWGYSINWGNGSTSGSTNNQSAAISGSRLYCAAGTYAVSLAVTDKDGDVGSAGASVNVARRAIEILVPPTFNLDANGKWPVHVLSAPGFDPSSLNPASITLAGVGISVKANGDLQMSTNDSNGDGMPDLVLHFDRPPISASGVLPASGTAAVTLLATGFDGCTQYNGSANTRVVQ